MCGRSTSRENMIQQVILTDIFLHNLPVQPNFWPGALGGRCNRPEIVCRQLSCYMDMRPRSAHHVIVRCCYRSYGCTNPMYGLCIPNRLLLRQRRCRSLLPRHQIPAKGKVSYTPERQCLSFSHRRWCFDSTCGWQYAG
jgi:hypothetical protein